MLKYKLEDCCEGESSEMHRGPIDPFEEQFGDPNDSGQGSVWSELSKGVAEKLSQSVFSIASFKGDVMLCACSGIVIRCEPLITTLLTSASLLRSSHDESRIENDLTIRVRYKYQQYIIGHCGDCDLDYNLLLVNIKTPRLPVARLDHQVQLKSCSKVLAVGRIFSSRKLTATSGLLKDTISIFDQEEIATSTCKISKAGIGGPLVDVDGYFHGMNFYGVEETPFLPRSIILKCLRGFGMFRDENKGGYGYTSRKMRSTNSNLDASPSCGFTKELVDQMHDRLRSCNYPLPTTICAGMHLNHSFDFLAANLNDPMEIKTASEVVAVGRVFISGKLTATRGIVTDKKSNLDCDKLMVSTCKITKVGIGGPLVDFSGNFIGMNFYDKEETPFMPRNDILECLRQFETRGIMAAENTVKRSPSRWPVPKPYWFYPTVEKPADPFALLTQLPMVDAVLGSGPIIAGTPT